MDINKLCPHCMREVSNGEVCPHCGHDIKAEQELDYQLRPFTILNGKYLVGDELGEGSSGITYIGLDITLKLRVAIKEFFLKDCMTRQSQAATQVTIVPQVNQEKLEQRREAFLNEAHDLAQCREIAEIVDVKGYFEENNTVYFVQEYLDGVTLQDYAASMGGRIPFHIFMPAMEPVIKALAQAHKQGVLHRAISPSHIMRMQDGTMKIFGLGAVYTDSAYMPVEQSGIDGNIGTWTDVYALCATFYKCLSGVFPVNAKERAQQDTLKLPSSFGVNIPHSVEVALMQGMAVQPEQRIRNMNALHNALYANYTSNKTVTQAQKETNQKKTETKTTEKTAAIDENQKNWTPLILGMIGGAIVLLVILLLILFFRGTSDKNGNTSQSTETTESISEEIGQDAAESAADGDSSELDVMAQHFEQAQDWSEQAEILTEYYSFLDANGIQENAEEQITEDYRSYCDNLNAFLDNMETAEPSPAIFGEMNNDLQTALEIAEELETRGVSVEYSQLEERKENLIPSYTERLCERYDTAAENAMQSNGQISRSELWKIMEGADSCGIYTEDDICNPVRTRYASALAFYVDSELEGKTTYEAVQLLYANLEQTQYSPLLLHYLIDSYAEESAASMYEKECSLLKETAGVDFASLSDAEKRNFVYCFSLQDYDDIRQEIISEIGAGFYNPYE